MLDVSLRTYVQGCLPLFMGFAYAATALFGTLSPRFETLGASMATQFSLMNGDVILETFDDIYAGA